MTTVEDILELKKSFKPEECSILRFAGAYVDSSKRIVTSFNKQFLNLEDTEFRRYLDIIKATYSKNIENNILNLSFNPRDLGQTKGFLKRLSEEGIKDEIAPAILWDKIIQTLNWIGNYLILLFHIKYDIVKRASDNTELDESEETYSYIQCIICPVELEKSGLEYHEDKNIIGSIDRDWIVAKPRIGFIYPSFEQRSSNDDSVIYFTSDTKDTKREFMTQVLCCNEKLTITQIQERFEYSFFRAMKSVELTEEYSEKFNAELGYLIDQDRLDEVLTAGDLEGILRKIKMPEQYAISIIDDYKNLWSDNWPRIHWIHNIKKEEAYHAKIKKHKGRALLEKAAIELGLHGISETAQDIQDYLESTR